MRIFFALSLYFFAFGNLHAQEGNTYFPEDPALIRYLESDSNNFSVQPIDTVQRKVKQIESGFTDFRDSLSINSAFADSLLPNNPAERLVQKIDTTKARISALEDSLRDKIRIPDSLKQHLPEGATLSDQKLPEVDSKAVEKLNGLGDVDELEKLKTDVGLNDITGIDGLDQAAAPPQIQELEALKEISGKAEELKGIKEIAGDTEKLSEAAENEAKNLKGVKAIEQNKGEFGQYEQQLEQAQDEDYFKEKTIEKAKEVATDHFAGQAEKLQAAQEKLAKIKRKYPEGVSSIKDLPKRRPNPMKGKPFKERLVLGLTIQIHPDQTPNVDASPFLGYKLTERLSFGFGGNYRLMTKNNFKGFTSKGAVYGYRSYSEFKVHKGFFVHAEYEMLKVPVRDSILLNVPEKVIGRGWVDGLLVGVGKDYKIANYVNGNMQVLYNFLHEGNSPYQNRVMVRFGFSFQLKDKIKKPDLSKEDVKDKFDRSVKDQTEKVKIKTRR